MQKKWGIYNGFNPKTNPLNKWHEPLCDKCESVLIPWIDWWNYGCIGYCESTNTLYIVKSDWRPSPEAHSRAEVDELIKHNSFAINTSHLTVDLNYIWNLHENLPIDKEDIQNLHEIKNTLDETEEGLIITHLIWSLIFNSDYLTDELISEYLEFVFHNPHYFKTSKNIELWIGHELDIVQRIEKSHKKELINSLYKLWIKYKDEYSINDFKTRVGFYSSSEEFISLDYNTDFYTFCEQIKQRL